MNSEASNEAEVAKNLRSAARPQHVLFAQSAPGTRFGLVVESEPSSLTLLAAGVAGLAARRARRRDRMQSSESRKTET